MKKSDIDSIRTAILEHSGFGKLNAMQEAMLADTSGGVVLLAPTGSGKTVAYTGKLMRFLGEPESRPVALIIAPSRELVQQITSVVRKLLPGYSAVSLYGGHPVADEVNRLVGSRPDIVIATPGRLLDHLSRGTFSPQWIKAVVIDEMDKCMDLGFLPDIKRILKRLPRPGCFIMSSATMPPEGVLHTLNGEMEILDFTEGSAAKKPDIEVVEVPSAQPDKLPVLVNLLDSLPIGNRTIVFVNHRESAERLFNALNNEGFPVGLYHGSLDQQERELALWRLKNGSTPVLIATDLASRGLDIPEVENVVHYHPAPSAETYTHRNGRTARAGASGTVYVIISDKENRPDYVESARVWYPSGSRRMAERASDLETLVFNVGKHDKISRGDILGFLTKQLGVDGTLIGRIDVADRYSAVAVPSRLAKKIAGAAAGAKIKNKRFRVTIGTL